MVAPIGDPRMADFVAWLDVINRRAERSTGFIWRLHDESGNATTGISVSVTRPRKAKITITTRTKAIISVTCTSVTEWTMLCERS